MRITIKVNGQPVDIAPATTLTTLLSVLQHDLRLVRVNLNGSGVHRRQWNTTLLQSGDEVTVLRLVETDSVVSKV